MSLDIVPCTAQKKEEIIMLVTMKELLDKASAGNYAVAAPNVSNELNARACIEAAEDMKAPLILDVAYYTMPAVC